MKNKAHVPISTSEAVLLIKTNRFNPAGTIQPILDRWTQPTLRHRRCRQHFNIMSYFSNYYRAVEQWSESKPWLYCWTTERTPICTRTIFGKKKPVLYANIIFQEHPEGPAVVSKAVCYHCMPFSKQWLEVIRLCPNSSIWWRWKITKRWRNFCSSLE